MRHKSLLTLLAIALGACTALDDAEYKHIETLVAKEKAITIAQTGGDAEIVIFASGPGKVEALNDFSAFAGMDKTSFSGDDTLGVSFTDNSEGHRRMAKLLLSLTGSEKKDTVNVFQEGVQDTLKCASPYASVNGASASVAKFAVTTNLSFDSHEIYTSYLSGATGWVISCRMENDTIYVYTSENPGETVSKARVTLPYSDGWGTNMDLNLYITLSDKNGDFGTTIDFHKAAEYAGKGKIKDNSVIEGIIVSDCRSMNMELNVNRDYNVVDTDENLRTAYLEALDGSMGFRMKYVNANDNVLEFGTRVLLDLNGTSIVRDEGTESFTITELIPANIVESRKGFEPVEKERTISQLSDSDMYTFTSLKNTEFVCKNGAFLNLYDNYSLKSEINSYGAASVKIFDGWAALLVDDSGKSIYAPINALCTWRRNQNGVPQEIKDLIASGAIDEIGVPQGTGLTKGIIVHNILRRYGDVGKYQIRVIDQDGFCQDWIGKSGYETLAKWDGAPYQYRMADGCYSKFNSRYAAPASSRMFDAIIPSDDISSSKVTPNAELTIENKTTCAYSSTPITRYYSHLALNGHGTEGKAGYLGRTSNSSYNDKLPCSLQSRQDIKGWFKWDGNRITGYNGYVISTSTKNISGTGMYVAYSYSIGAISATTSQYFPAHWCIEYSIDGGKTFKICPDSATGKDYTHLHTLPWASANIGGIQYYTSGSCGMGSTEHVAFLPPEVFGQDNLLIRLRPYDDIMSIFPLSWDGETENSRVYSNTTASVLMNIEYLYLRYR